MMETRFLPVVSPNFIAFHGLSSDKDMKLGVKTFNLVSILCLICERPNSLYWALSVGLSDLYPSVGKTNSNAAWTKLLRPWASDSYVENETHWSLLLQVLSSCMREWECWCAMKWKQTGSIQWDMCMSHVKEWWKELKTQPVCLT